MSGAAPQAGSGGRWVGHCDPVDLLLRNGRTSTQVAVLMCGRRPALRRSVRSAGESTPPSMRVPEEPLRLIEYRSLQDKSDGGGHTTWMRASRQTIRSQNKQAARSTILVRGQEANQYDVPFSNDVTRNAAPKTTKTNMSSRTSINYKAVPRDAKVAAT